MMSNKNELTSACRRLTPTTIASLLSAYIDEGWTAAGTYAKGPCPVGVGGCTGDDRAAYAYPSTSGWAPWVRCHHRSCGYRTSIFDMLVDRLGALRAIEAIKAAADGTIDHASPATTTTTTRSGRGPSPARKKTTKKSSDSAAAEELELRFPSNVLVTRSEKSEPAAAIVLDAVRGPSVRTKKPMFTFELGLASFEGVGRAPLFVSYSMPFFVASTLTALRAEEYIGLPFDDIPLEELLGREAIAHVQLEVGEYGPRTKVVYLSPYSGGLIANPDVLALIVSARGR